jgi:hypothetical protein
MYNDPKNTELNEELHSHLNQNPATSVEAQLLKDLLTHEPDDLIKTCHGIVRLAKSGGDLSELRQTATGPLLKLVITSLNKEVRYSALSAFLSLRPSLENAAIRFAEKLEAETAKRIYETGKSLYAGNYDWANFPLAEQILISGTILCNSLMRAHFISQGASDNEYIQFACIALEEGLRGLKVIESMDKLSSYRPLLPLEIRTLQNDLNSLTKEGILKNEIKIISLSNRAKTKNLEITAPDKSLGQSRLSTPSELEARVAADLSATKNKSDHLCKKLAVAKTFSEASAIIITLGEHGDMRAIQALKQTQMGLVDGGGMFLRLNSDERNHELITICKSAIARIIDRAGTQT